MLKCVIRIVHVNAQCFMFSNYQDNCIEAYGCEQNANPGVYW